MGDQLSKLLPLPRHAVALGVESLAQMALLRVAAGCNRLSSFWLPTQKRLKADNNEDFHETLLRAGFMFQSHAGIYHLLPVGLRVQQKLERLLDKRMAAINAARLSMSSITSELLWQQSGRFSHAQDELFRFQDRKRYSYMLSPTHEEEITTIVAHKFRSAKDLPLRLYQITRKYRDEPRPRQGLLRTREFVMKDLYTFDDTFAAAKITYDEVQETYRRVFTDLRLPYMVAEADSGSMGGVFSHEYVLPSALGEDWIVQCNRCHYIANQEVAQSNMSLHMDHDKGDPKLFQGISFDRRSLINVWYPPVKKTKSSANCDERTPVSEEMLDLNAVKALEPSLDTSASDPLSLWHDAMRNRSTDEDAQVYNIVTLIDGRVDESMISSPTTFISGEATADSRVEFKTLNRDIMNRPLNLVRIQNGDACPKCIAGILHISRALELGHTFHLGTRYSTLLRAYNRNPGVRLLESTAEVPQNAPLQMGCHGIGVTRLLGAIASHFRDNRGLNWPQAISPFQVVIIPGINLDQDAEAVYNKLASTNDDIDVALDDRLESVGWKIKDAELVGYPIIILLGATWKNFRQCEIHCRQLDMYSSVPFSNLVESISALRRRLL